MTFGLWGPFDDQTPFSYSKANGMTVISGTGTDLETLDKAQFRIVFCTADGGSLLKDHTYAVDTDSETFIDISTTGSHNHGGPSDGGSVIDIFSGNPTFADTGSYFMHNIDKARWVETVTSTGSTANDNDGTSGELSLKLLTGATSGASATLAVKGLKLNFAKRSSFQFKARIETTTSIALHSGVNADDVTAVDSSTAKYDAEVCTVTNNNWNLRSASGSNKTSSDTGIAISVNRVGIRLEHYPDIGVPEVDMYLDANTVFQKTSDVPITGTTAVANLMKHSLKNSAASARNYFVYANRLRYYILDNWV
jgi:hypothetical protein